MVIRHGGGKEEEISSHLPLATAMTQLRRVANRKSGGAFQ
jgi:hypothetical protein